MATLTGSVQKARASRGADAYVHELPQKKAAKKQPAEKTAPGYGLRRRSRQRSQTHHRVRLVRSLRA
ncbi:hypothetical protein [Streptomyces coeruleorubidus]|uniref:hypothetical protein n=1 Tax=Streptomyces coeruleorubidus TaxID=116188 RepID=UPI00364FACEC